jgi:hypothetical protein
MAGREDIGAELDEDLRELSLETSVCAPLIDPFAELPAVSGIVESTGECVYSGFQPRPARGLGTPSFGERRQTGPAPGPQILIGYTRYQIVTNGRYEVWIVQIHDPRGPGAEVVA